MRVDVLTGKAGDNRFGRDFSLLDEAERRYPEEPRFRLALVVAARPARTVANRPGVGLTTIAGLSRVSAGAAEQHVTDTLRRLDDLAGDGPIGAEARLRAGMIRFHLGEAEQALEDARHAAEDEEPFVRYLGHLLAGHVLVHLGRDAEAIRAYERAVAINSRARSGVVALSSRLVVAERHDEAYVLLENYFAADAAVDPWLQYGWGDYRLWPSYLLRLRALIAPSL
jgi:tetratricopeptide (TPR) repeat protein